MGMGEYEDKDIERMIVMKLSGCTYNMIGRTFGISRQRVQQLLRPPREICDYVIKKYHGRCCRCGLEVGNRGHIHHNGDIIDKYNDIEALQLLCISCHMHIHGRLIQDSNSIPITYRTESTPKMPPADEGPLQRWAETELQAKQDKYQELISRGVPSVLARQARNWSKKTIKDRLGIELK